MTTVLLYADAATDLDRQFAWALRIAAQRGDELRILVRSGESDQGDVQAIELGAEGIGAELSAQLDRWVGAWRTQEERDAEDRAREEAEEEAPEETEDPPTPSVRAWLLPPAGVVDRLIERVREEKPDLVVAMQVRLENEDADSSERRRRIVREVPYELVLLRAGAEVPDSDSVLVGVSHGPHCAAALRLARDLTPEGERFTALFVQQRIGADAASVGRRILDRTLRRTLGDDAERAEPLVNLNDRPHVGVREACEEREPGLLVLGASKLGALGQRLRGSLGQRVINSDESRHVAVVRAAVSLEGRALRRFVKWLEDRVPQLEREARIDLVERVQSNSAWDFDILALMSLATLIASAGLILDSAAVIIGAMLVAPLMTPLIGMGLSLVQGNRRLLALSARTVSLGFLSSVVIGFLVALVVPRFAVPTPEMVARDWPQLLDLWIAFFAGIAGAYTSSRPGLLAALPGVAIAAALLPPLATAGLALGIADFDLAGGALLLFLVNAVAIVLATTFALWGVGLRPQSEGGNLTRKIGAAFVAALSALALYLAFERPVYRSPDSLTPELRRALAECLDPDLRLVHGAFAREEDGRVLVVELGGPRRPDAESLDAIRAAVADELGREPRLRLVHRFELEAR